jgi:exopolysaccharide production protein ExoY
MARSPMYRKPALPEVKSDDPFILGDPMTLPLRPQDLNTAQGFSLDTQYQGATNGVYARLGKRILDIVLVLALLPVAIPVVAVCALALLILGDSPFYCQKRLGMNGHVFRIWKLRTMRQDADQVLADLLATNPQRKLEWERTQKLKDDPRVTWLGSFLRRTSIDELPQLLNVLTGDMSMIGPRPMMLDQADLYGPTLPAYLRLRPGISGKWQVTERNDADFRRRALIDLEYSQELGLRTDLHIAARTVMTILRSTGH